MGKGSKQRPTTVPRAQYEDNWSRTFGSKRAALTDALLHRVNTVRDQLSPPVDHTPHPCASPHGIAHSECGKVKPEDKQADGAR